MKVHASKAPRRSALAALVCAALAFAACGGADEPGESNASAGYVVAANIYTTEVSSMYMQVLPDVPKGTLDLATAREVAGGGTIRTFEGRTYVTSEERKTVTRHELAGGKLEPRETVSFTDQGFDYLGQPYFLDAQRAFFMNGAQLTVVEWNPTTMELTRTHSIAGMKRDGWAHEERGAFLRRADGKLFFYWTYTNERKTFINNFVVGVLDTVTSTLKVLEDADCPATAGFGGFFDEAGDLYLFSDNFGGYTRLAGVPDPKTACVLRVRPGQDAFDPGFRWKPTETLGSGLEPWGLYYAGNGVAYTTAVDPARLEEYDGVFEFIFAPIHQGYTLDFKARAATKLSDLPLDGVGFESVPFGGRLLVPRSTGKVKVYDIETVDTTVYSLDGATGVVSELFKMPGYLETVQPLR
jgi:hypothetical protein